MTESDIVPPTESGHIDPVSTGGRSTSIPAANAETPSPIPRRLRTQDKTLFARRGMALPAAARHFHQPCHRPTSSHPICVQSRYRQRSWEGESVPIDKEGPQACWMTSGQLTLPAFFSASSITIPKFESRPHYDKITAPIHPVAVGLPSPPVAFTQDHFRYSFEQQQHYLGLHMSDRTAPECYRASHEHGHEHLYYPDQSPPPNLGENMRDVTTDGSPTAQNGFSHLHSATSMGYSYPMDMLKAPRD